jgi:hypothetical protein
MSVTAKAARLDRGADQSYALDVAIRIGLLAYGVVHLLIAWLAVRLVFGRPGQSASSQGALHELARTSAGRLSLYVVAGGLLALAVWQLIEAAVGHRDARGGKRALKRATSAGKVLVYGTLGVSAFRTATGSGSGGGGTHSTTAKLMAMPGGPLIVAAVGVGIFVVAGFLVHRGLKDKFMKNLDIAGHTGNDGKAYRWFGRVGYVTKGLALAIIGGLFVWAAVSHDPQRSGGLDQALRKLLHAPFGGALLLAVAAGIACYGLFCFAWARHLEQ